MKKSSTYWKKRFSDLEAAQHSYAQQTFRSIEEPFDKAQQQIQSQIESWYARYASNNGISMMEARKQLSAAELKELQWDVQTYIKAGQENALDGRWMKELENASARFHISRLEALKLRTQQQLEVAFGNQLDSVDGLMKELYQSGYYHTCFEIQKGFGLGWEIGQIDERKLSKVVSRPWAADGKNFSDRIWSQKTQMVNSLHQQLTRTIIQGKAPDEAIKEITKYVTDKTKNAKVAAGRLVMTESAFISSAAQKDAFKDLDVDEFEIVATLDSHTSEICQEMDGQHFPMKDFEPGVTAPPFHPYCRSTTVPYFDDEWGRSGERAARDEEGNTYYVPADMKYPDWKDSFVDGHTDELKPIDPGDTIKVKEQKAVDVEVPASNESDEDVIQDEPIPERPIEYKESENKDYVRLMHGSQGSVSFEDRMQIAKHEKPDGSQGGYVATTNYQTINSNMRKDGFTGNQLDEDDLKTIESMRRAISQYQIDDDLVFTRYVNADYLSSVFGIQTKLSSKAALENISDSITRISNPYVVKEGIPLITQELQAQIGNIITEKSFLSASAVPTKNIMKDKSVIFKIRAKTGTHCYVPVNRRESEIIFGDDSKLLIQDAVFDETQRKWIITVDIE